VQLKIEMKREEEAVEEEVLRRNMKMEVGEVLKKGEGVEEAHKVVKAGEEVMSRNRELILISGQVLETQPSFLHL